MTKPQNPHSDHSTLVTMDYDGDGYPQTQVAPMGDGGTNAKAEARHPYGSIGRPADADQDPTTAEVTNGANVKTDKEGSTLQSMALDDPRVTNLLPQVPKGGHQDYGGQPKNPATVSYDQHDGQGNYKVHVPAGGTVTIEIAGGPSIVVSAGKVSIKGVSPAVPVVVGDTGTPPLPTQAVVLGTPQTGQVASTILFCQA